MPPIKERFRNSTSSLTALVCTRALNFCALASSLKATQPFPTAFLLAIAFAQTNQLLQKGAVSSAIKSIWGSFFLCIRKRFCRSKEKSLEMRRKRVRQKEDRQNPCFLSVYSVAKNCAKRRSVGTDQAQISLFSLCYRAFLCLRQRQEGKIEFLRSSYHVSKSVWSHNLP